MTATRNGSRAIATSVASVTALTVAVRGTSSIERDLTEAVAAGERVLDHVALHDLDGAVCDREVGVACFSLTHDHLTGPDGDVPCIAGDALEFWHRQRTENAKRAEQCDPHGGHSRGGVDPRAADAGATTRAPARTAL